MNDDATMLIDWEKVWQV